jgi:spectinomycin phosphotransferase
MLTRPDIADDRIVASLHANFGLRVSQVTFLPIGADVNSAAFRISADDGAAYFLKLRRGNFNEIAVEVPTFLHGQGIRSVMAPIATTANRLSTRADGSHLMLYPYFEGKNGFVTALTKGEWIALGKSLKAIHATELPAELSARLPREDFAPRLRNVVKEFDRQIRRRAFDDPIAARFAAFWISEGDSIGLIVQRAEILAQALVDRPVDLVVCHSDLHGGNVLVGTNDELAIVDWDEPILAPIERDLMFVGGGVGGIWNRSDEAAWFYEGYGPATVDPNILAYYRYERIVADFAAYAEEILGGTASAEDRERGLRQVMGQFLPGNVIEMAHGSFVSQG